MDSDDFPALDANIDYTAILPIQQKRTIAFVNHFIMKTVSFLNHFAQSCESRLMEFEYKMQKVEASLLILEAQLSSIPRIDVKTDDIQSPRNENPTLELPVVVAVEQETSEAEASPKTGLVASLDPRFSKFFKMVQVGVPAQAVKNKMLIEGIDPAVLDKPGEVFPGSTAEKGDLNVSVISSLNSD